MQTEPGENRNDEATLAADRNTVLAAGEAAHAAAPGNGSVSSDAAAKDAIQGVLAGTNGSDPAGAPNVIDQVRDLLFGGAQRNLESSVAALREEIENALRRLHADFNRDLTAVRAKLADLEEETERRRLASLRDVGAAIAQLGGAVNELGQQRPDKHHEPGPSH
jgi:hypothetical protein